MRGYQRGSDHRQRIIDPKQHIIVPKANHAISQLLETARTGFVVGLLIEMLAAIQFDDETRLQTNEIGIETIDPMLAAEFAAEQAAITKMLPEDAFGFGLLATQAAFAQVGLWAAHGLLLGEEGMVAVWNVRGCRCFLKVVWGKPAPHPALRATFSPRCGEKESKCAAGAVGGVLFFSPRRGARRATRATSAALYSFSPPRGEKVARSAG